MVIIMNTFQKVLPSLKKSILGITYAKCPNQNLSTNTEYSAIINVQNLDIITVDLTSTLLERKVHRHYALVPVIGELSVNIHRDFLVLFNNDEFEVHDASILFQEILAEKNQVLFPQLPHAIPIVPPVFLQCVLYSDAERVVDLVLQDIIELPGAYVG